MTSALDALLHRHRLPAPVYVTRPTMPSLASYHASLEKIWQSGWLTNDGRFHVEFESALKRYLQIDHMNLFANGTLALLVALQALGIDDGEVITTPFTFPATTHVLHWNRVTPVFCDIDPSTYNIDPADIERHITPDTRAILAVHVYGTPCDVHAIQSIAKRHDLHVIYDAAHAFGVRLGGRSILEHGDLSALSFHATKLFNSIEGGALISHSVEQRTRIHYLRNFGISDEETVIGPGINGKMNEFQASFGLLQLELIEEEIANRRRLTHLYRHRLATIPGITCLADMPDVEHNYAFFPVLIEPAEFGHDRNGVHDALRKCNVHARKYFYPLCSQYACYSSLPSASPDKLPVANRIAERVLCLPLYGQLEEAVVDSVCSVLEGMHHATGPEQT
ncbi:MAG: DegT/DnrJ/EryC1/StrS family aminotransferase [Planctomycetota bacterium]